MRIKMTNAGLLLLPLSKGNYTLFKKIVLIFPRKRKDQEKIYMQAAGSSPVSPIASEGPFATEEALAAEAP